MYEIKPVIYYNSNDDIRGKEIKVLDIENPKFSKFISEYQSRIYEEDYDGKEFMEASGGNVRINNKCFLEYFSEGYRMYNEDKTILRIKDPYLYDFIEGMV